MNDKKLNELLALFESGGAYEVLNTYLKLHEGKIGAHWLWCAIERLNLGESESAILADYGYHRQ
jgi:hypothetical protein